jgi:hypothetical protein
VRGLKVGDRVDYRSGSAHARRRGDLCQRWRRNNLHRQRRD